MATKQTDTSGKSSVMAQLMARQQKTFNAYKKGELVIGTITKMTPHEILVDINAKSEAVVLEHDKQLLRQMLATLHVGDKVTVSILDPESDNGYPVVSLRRFLDDLLWKELTEKHAQQTPVTITIQNSTKGGYLVATDAGLTGFLPQSQLLASQQQLSVGAHLDVLVLDLDRALRKIIFSQKATQGADFSEVKKTLKTGDRVKGVITTVTPFGLFLSVPIGEDKFVDGLIHISELAWEKIETIEDLYTVGDELEAAVIGFDENARRLDLSLKRLTQDPFDTTMQKYTIDTKVKGTITEISDQGITVALENTQGFIKKEKLPPTITYTVGDTLSATVAEIDKRKRRILLTPVLREKPIGYR